MLFWLLFLLSFGWNVAIAIVAVRANDDPSNPWRRSRALRLGLGAGAVGLMLGFVLASHDDPLVSIPMKVFLGLTFAPYAVLLGGHSFDTVRAWMRSDHQVKVEKTYDRAEAAERMHDWDRAIALYEEELAADPADLEARRRLAEALVLRGRLPEAVRHLATVLPAVIDREKRAHLAFRLAELHERQGDADAARRVLLDLIVHAPGRQLEEGVRVRLARLERAVPAARAAGRRGV